MLFYFVSLLVILPFSEEKVSCKNENNDDVDWFIVLKYPNSGNYYYLESDMNNGTWRKPNYALTSEKNLVGLTLSQAYSAKSQKTFYAFYNDDKAKLEKSNGGHLKGVVNFDNATGYWLVHSVPKFPMADRYFYPMSEEINGQSFICVSLKTSNLKQIAKQLLIMYSMTYSYNFPATFSTDSILNGLLDKVVHNLHSPGDLKSTVPIETIKGEKLMHFAKSKNFVHDLYAHFIAIELETALFTETWQHGENLPSRCNATYKVYNVKKVQIEGLKFSEYRDHSKWAVGANLSKPVVCIGDINRMESQYFRGGGSLCVFNVELWKTFRKIVYEYEKCSSQ